MKYLNDRRNITRIMLLVKIINYNFDVKVNNNYMNQILYNKKNNRLRYLYKVQLLISIVVAIIFIVLIILNYNTKQDMKQISIILNKNLELSSIYEIEKTNREQTYFGKIYIETINLEYMVFNNFNEELLNIAPCKFFGVNLGERGNIGITAHNYDNNTFFSRIDELEIGDQIILSDLNKNKYDYTVFDIFETDEDNMSVLNSSKDYELTLVTCNNKNKKRIIVKGYSNYVKP